MTDSADRAWSTLAGNLEGVNRAIETCLDQRLIMPTLVLVYSAIDVVASLDQQESERPRATFMRWVDRYLMKPRSLPCSSLELYSARCAILHTLTADSDLTRSGTVRPLVYAWGSGDQAKLQAVVNKTRELAATPPFAAIHVTDLVRAFRSGVGAFLDDLRRDATRAERARAKASFWFTPMSQDRVEEFLYRLDVGRDK